MEGTKPAAGAEPAWRRRKMGRYRGKWVIMIGFKAEALKTIAPIVEELKKKYPEQEYNIGNSKFKQYDFILFCFARNRDEAHKIGMSLVKKHLPPGYCYWIKEINLLKYNVRVNEQNKQAL